MPRRPTQARRAAGRERPGRPRGWRPSGLSFYAGLCGWTLARAHARSGDPVAIAAYVGGTDAFDRSVAKFARLYADRNEQDYEQFVTSVRSGRPEALQGV